MGFKRIDSCVACGYAWAVPTVSQDQLNEFYNSGRYWAHAAESGSAYVEAHSRCQARVRAEFVLSRSRRKFDSPELRVLDIGAGHAFLAEVLTSAASGAAVRYTFFEPDENLALSNLKRLAPLGKADRMDSLQSDRRFDVIFLNQVLEHVADPASFLTAVAGLLDPQGVLYIEVPNRDDKFKHDVFPHVHFFSADSLERLGRTCGLVCDTIEEFGGRRSVGQPGIRGRLLSRLFRVSVDLKIERVAFLANKLLVDYRKQENGIWLRGLFSKRL